MHGTVEGIYIAEESGQPMRAVSEVTGEAGRGLVGDRYYRATGQPGGWKPGSEVQDLTLVEIEALDMLREEHGIELAPAEIRRNVVTRGIRLNDLVGRQFRVGSLLCEGTELCEPCAHMQQRVGKPILKALVHRGGLRARILASGTVRVGDPVTAQAATSPA